MRRYGGRGEDSETRVLRRPLASDCVPSSSSRVSAVYIRCLQRRQPAGIPTHGGEEARRSASGALTLSVSCLSLRSQWRFIFPLMSLLCGGESPAPAFPKKAFHGLGAREAGEKLQREADVLRSGRCHFSFVTQPSFNTLIYKHRREEMKHFMFTAHSSISPKTSKRRFNSVRVQSDLSRPTYTTRLSSCSLRGKTERREGD
ncbi:hypothetical protein EYF80_018378 [Liparis tanakae]|uniref:Uncharacterized protein n=1 Tax=Liparis tanakae TaxID=230148 RepID=A0A4Z2I005_9TELE|nr:hypothetical protein EYF80_018378 [Liparis tanakae]